MADEEQKTEHINLKVAGQDGSVVQFKIKKVRKAVQTHNWTFLKKLKFLSKKIWKSFTSYSSLFESTILTVYCKFQKITH